MSKEKRERKREEERRVYVFIAKMGYIHASNNKWSVIFLMDSFPYNDDLVHFF